MSKEQISGQQQAIQKIVKNLTARRIGIRATREASDERLIIPPFGSIIVDENVLSDFEETGTWVKRNLITVKTVPISPDADVGIRQAAPGCVMLLYIPFLIITVSLAIFPKLAWGWPAAGIGTVVFIIAMAISFFYAFKPKKEQASKETSGQYGRWFLLLPSLILALAIGFGIPALVIYFFGGGREVLSQAGTANLIVLGRGVQLGFISIASTLPALMYFMFGRQQLEKLRDNFIREAMMLDPNIQTTLEAETKYDPLFESVYGIGNTPLDSLPIYFSTILITFGWILTLLPIGQNITLEGRTLVTLLTPHATALNYGFLGAYFFTVNMVFRRYVRADLTAKTYTYISIRFLVTAILVWAVSSLPGLQRGDSGTQSTGTLILAFFIGIFPETGTALMQDFYRKAFGRIIKSLEEEHPLTNLEGINLYDRARLLEEGIENIENLAHHNLLELVAKTRIPTPRIVDMFDQAILYIHLGLESNKLLETRQQLREYGIRTATDLQQMKDNLPDLLKDVTPALVNRLKVIECALSDDEWMEYLNQWKSATKSDTVFTLEDFYIGRPRSGQPRDRFLAMQVVAP